MAEQSTTTWGWIKVLQVRASAWFPVFTSLEHVCSTPKYVYNIIGFDPSRHPKNQKSQWWLIQKAKRILKRPKRGSGMHHAEKLKECLWHPTLSLPSRIGVIGQVWILAMWWITVTFSLCWLYLQPLLLSIYIYIHTIIYIYIYTYKPYNDNICIIPEYILRIYIY